MAKITVTLRKQCICTVDGTHMTVFPAKMRRGRRTVPLQECAGIDVPDIEISVRRWIFQRTLEIPQEIREGIVEFLRTYSVRKDWPFDCYAFANLVHDVRPHRTELLLRFWETKPFKESLDVGQTVFFLTESEQMFHHAAIYLGIGLYISVYGIGGNLEIASLTDMKEDFGAADVVLATPLPQTTAYF